MKKHNLSSTYSFALLVASVTVVFSGCASGTCGPRGPFANQPIRNFFRGAFCNTCNPPAGNANCGTNVAPGCNSGNCNLNGGMAPTDSPIGTPGAFAIPGNGVSYYGDPSLNNNPVFASPSTSQNYPGTDIYGNSDSSAPTVGSVGG